MTDLIWDDGEKKAGCGDFSAGELHSSHWKLALVNGYHNEDRSGLQAEVDSVEEALLCRPCHIPVSGHDVDASRRLARGVVEIVRSYTVEVVMVPFAELPDIVGDPRDELGGRFAIAERVWFNDGYSA